MRATRLVLALAGILVRVPGAAQCPPRAVQVVREFLQLDFEGYGLQGGKEHDRMWQLSLQNAEGGEGPIRVTRVYEIVSAIGDRSACRVNVRFTLYGSIDQTDNGELFFTSRRAREEATWDILCARTTCRIAFKQWPLPHPGRAATTKFLIFMESNSRTPPAKEHLRRLRQRIEALQ